MTTTKMYRAYHPTTEWSGPIRSTIAAAMHDARCVGGRIVVQRDDDGYLQRLCGTTVWPPHGRSSGAAQWI